MHVPAQRVAGARRDGNMAREERCHRVRLGHDLHAPGGGRVAGAIVVIAAHEQDVDRRLQFAPAAERRIEGRDAARRGVQEIAEHDEPPRAGLRKDGRQTREIRRRAPARQRHPAGAKRRGLAEMDVGDEHRALARPMQRTRREQLDTFAVEGGGVHAGRLARCGRSVKFKIYGDLRHDGFVTLSARWPTRRGYPLRTPGSSVTLGFSGF